MATFRHLANSCTKNLFCNLQLDCIQSYDVYPPVALRAHDRRDLFAKVPCKGSMLDARAEALARWHLRPDPRSDALTRPLEHRASV